MKKTLFLVITLLALFACNEDPIPTKYYTVNFVGESVDIESQSVEHGKYVIAPENPERENHNFIAWFTDKGTFINQWDFNADIVTCDTTLYAKWEGNYPIEIPFVDFFLDETRYQWKNLNYDYRLPFYKVIVINSEKELENYIECIEGNSYPVIDFDTQTLLLAIGVVGSSVVKGDCKNIQQLSERRYEMEVEILEGHLTVLEEWQVPIIINKINDDSIIELLITEEDVQF
ncbi:InlB B-repeat-containing protein [Bacteroidales bacterium OttesenSCG-928-I14]|nr:InlB B-repeat-containing protein [Bacteroidales bacterium OttesenSCG-928-I14]